MFRQRDIARELNVSQSLISKVLSNRLGTSRVSPQLVEAIRRMAAEKNYRKNHLAHALATGREGMIGVFVYHGAGQASSGIIESALKGISDMAVRSGQHIMLQFFDTPEAFQRSCPGFQRTLFDALILVGPTQLVPPEELLQVQARGIRVVTICDDPISPAILNIGLDQQEVERLATAHLIECGCQRIAHITMRPSRYKGYEAALQAAGMPIRQELVYQDAVKLSEGRGWGVEAGRQAVTHFAAQGIEYDGLVTQSDNQAVGACNTLFRMGRRVPEDVKIVGVDNSPMCEVAAVPLSSVSQEFRTRGRIAMEVLVRPEYVNQESIPTVQPVLYVRESSVVTH